MTNPPRSRSANAFRLLDFLVRLAVRRRFCGGFIRGLNHLNSLPPDTPVLAAANHSNWWDGFAAVAVSGRLAGRECYLMQEEKHLAKYPFFRLAGAFGIDLDGSALGGFRMAVRILNSPGRLVWMFPQGRFQPPGETVSIRPGVAALARRTGASIVPIHFRYPWLYESRPALCIDCAPPLPPDAGTADVEDAMEQMRRQLEHDHNIDAYSPLVRPGLSLNKQWERLSSPFRKTNRNQPFEPWNR